MSGRLRQAIGPSRHPERDEAILAAVGAGLSYSEIGRRIGLHKDSVRAVYVRRTGRIYTQKPSLRQRFWAKADRSLGLFDCWPWLGGRTPTGYGSFWSIEQGGMIGAHRVAYELAVGEIPHDLELDHLCHNRACVNPSHLEPVTHGENLRRRRKVTG